MKSATIPSIVSDLKIGRCPSARTLWGSFGDASLLAAASELSCALYILARGGCINPLHFGNSNDEGFCEWRCQAGLSNDIESLRDVNWKCNHWTLMKARILFCPPHTKLETTCVQRSLKKPSSSFYVLRDYILLGVASIHSY
jgi:hypothetical protein